MIKINVNKILKVRERNLKWLATKADITYSTLYNFANNKTNAVSYNVLEKLVKVLNVSIGDLIEIVDDNSTSK